MEKVLQILAVSALLMLLIWRSIRGRDERFRRFSYLSRLRPPLVEEVVQRLISGKFRITERSEGYERRGAWRSEVLAEREEYGVPDEADAFLWDEESRLLFFYRVDGRLTVNRRMAGGRNMEMQELSVPMDCTGLGWDPLERTIYLEEDGDWFVYGEEG